MDMSGSVLVKSGLVWFGFTRCDFRPGLVVFVGLTVGNPTAGVKTQKALQAALTLVGFFST